MYITFFPSFLLENSPVLWSFLCQPDGKSEGNLLARKKRHVKMRAESLTVVNTNFYVF
jgi:hypothetical protein